MEIHDEIIEMIENVKYISKPVSVTSNLYIDVGFDSLAFINFLMKIEERYLITFGIEEIGLCFQVDRLIALVKNKVKERDNDDSRFINEAE